VVSKHSIIRAARQNIMSNAPSSRQDSQLERRTRCPFASDICWHGGFTEAAESDLTEFEIRAQGRHKSAKVLPRYGKRTMRQVAEGARKRRATRTQGE
jgi:hypothetical protein